MNTRIVIQADPAGKLTSSAQNVDIADGSSVTFTAEGVDALLCFADETAAVLSPSPEGPTVVASGSSARYVFGKAAPGGYPVMILHKGSVPPSIIDFAPGATDALLTISIPSGRPTPGAISDDSD